MTLIVGKHVWRCGDTVREKGGRHEGVVQAVFSNNVVRVRWDTAGSLSDLFEDEIEVIRRIA